MAVKIKNTTKEPNLPDYAVRRAISWVCGQLDLKVGEVKSLELRNRQDGNSSGRIWTRTGEIVISVGYALVHDEQRLREYAEAGVPLYKSSCWWHTVDGGDGTRRVGGTPGVRMRFGILMGTLAHEIAHRALYVQKAGKGPRNGRYGSDEKVTQWHADKVVAVWKAQRKELLDAWLEPPKARAAAKPAKDRRVSRAETDAELLKTWERKLALAKTKVGKYKAKVSRARREGLL